ncbi:MAG: DNA-binding protein WhiA [Clostridia bacterium]|nr:DNA-binding protein WhiA [Clostridia bacterium]
MSFAEKCREELIRIRLHAPNERLAQLVGLTMTAAGIRLFPKPSVFYQTESLPVAKHIAQLAQSDYALESVIERKERESRRRALYTVNLSGADSDRYLSDVGALCYGEEGVRILSTVGDAVFADEETERAFLRGCFLGGGTCVDPKRSYHVELICRVESVAEQVSELLIKRGLHPHKTNRKERIVVYLKEGDDVAGFLALIGANTGALSLETVRVEKDMRNYVNRMSNCETANLDKQVVASLKQRAAIRKIQEHMSLDDLPVSLREAAELRLNYPDATLAELAEYAGIRKSGMNHRLTRLMELANETEGLA